MHHQVWSIPDPSHLMRFHKTHQQQTVTLKLERGPVFLGSIMHALAKGEINRGLDHWIGLLDLHAPCQSEEGEYKQCCTNTKNRLPGSVKWAQSIAGHDEKDTTIWVHHRPSILAA